LTSIYTVVIDFRQYNCVNFQYHFTEAVSKLSILYILTWTKIQMVITPC